MHDVRSLPVKIVGSAVTIGDHFQFTVVRTLRVPMDGKTYPLPAGLGTFPVKKVDDYRKTVPAHWLERGGIFIPMYQREAAWVCFGGWDPYSPVAVRVSAGKVCAVTGKPFDGKLSGSPQNFMVVPGQPWLDGFKTAEGRVSQFVAMPLGGGFTVEQQITGDESVGGLQIQVWQGTLPRPVAPIHVGLQKDWQSDVAYGSSPLRYAVRSQQSAVQPTVLFAGVEMGLAAGGAIEQTILATKLGTEVFDGPTGRVFVHIVNSELYREITGEEPPPTPVTREEYRRRGIPWFEVYQESASDVAVQQALANVKDVTTIDAEKGQAGVMDTESIPEVAKPGPGVRDGRWPGEDSGPQVTPVKIFPVPVQPGPVPVAPFPAIPFPAPIPVVPFPTIPIPSVGRRPWQGPDPRNVPVIPPNPDRFKARPFEPNPVVARCGQCGLELRQVMGYACPQPNCPTGLGGKYTIS